MPDGVRPPRSSSTRVYYVNAARVIAGIHPPAGAPYAHAPLGSDPNAEHPQLAKLIIAGSIELFGDDAVRVADRQRPVRLARDPGDVRARPRGRRGPWVALCAAALMALDNLLLVHGRIGTLDVYALAAMLWGAVAYLRGRPLLAGVIARRRRVLQARRRRTCWSCCVVLELLRRLRDRGWRACRAVVRVCALAAAAVVFLALLTLLDRVAPPYDPVTGQADRAAARSATSRTCSPTPRSQSSPHGPSGIASYPWEWLGDYKPIVYLNINPSQPAPGLTSVHPAVHFLGMISPPILLLGAARARPRGAWSRLAASPRAGPRLDGSALAWFARDAGCRSRLLSLVWSADELPVLHGDRDAGAVPARRRR